MIFVCMYVWIFSDGKGGKEEKRQVPEKGGIWCPERLGNKHSGPHLEIWSLDCIRGMHWRWKSCWTLDIRVKEKRCGATAFVWCVFWLARLQIARTPDGKRWFHTGWWMWTPWERQMKSLPWPPTSVGFAASLAMLSVKGAHRSYKNADTTKIHN